MVRLLITSVTPDDVGVVGPCQAPENSQGARQAPPSPGVWGDVSTDADPGPRTRAFLLVVGGEGGGGGGEIMAGELV